MSKIYGYARISTKKQSIARQVDNIKSKYADAIIIEESFTGTKIDRPKFSRLLKMVKSGDTIVFDEVSRMSRDAADGFKTYQDLYDRGINLVFLKESTLNTDNFKQVTQIAMTDTDVDLILEGINKYMMKLAENQIKSAFATAEHEVEFLHKRTSEGVRKAQAEGKQVGLAKGSKVETKKSIEMKNRMQKHLKAFGGSMNDKEFMEMTHISRNTFYKYKKELTAA